MFRLITSTAYQWRVVNVLYFYASPTQIPGSSGRVLQLRVFASARARSVTTASEKENDHTERSIALKTMAMDVNCPGAPTP